MSGATDTLMHDALLAALDDEQRAAATHGQQRANGGASACGVDAGPVLVVAGPGCGKTATLAHRVGWLLACGVPPERILLLAFSRRAALELTERAGRLLASPGRDAALHLPWAGTFHSVGARLLRAEAHALGLDAGFSVLDRGDAVDLMDWVRERHGHATAKTRFPRAATCSAIHSDCVNTGDTLDTVLQRRYPWCLRWAGELKAMFRDYAGRKHAEALLDFDDLLLWWREAAIEPGVAERLRARFDHVLVDEFQDSNRLQIDILHALVPQGRGLFVVGDDAQAIYGFRGGDVAHMHGFPASFDPPARVITLRRNYRSTQPILDTANALAAQSAGPFDKRLVAVRRAPAPQPTLATVSDDAAQAGFVADQVLAAREAGSLLAQQAVLFRSAHHSDRLEVELLRRDIPFVKHGGLRFIAAAHIKDALAALRWARNARHALAAMRVLQLVPGIGSALARRCHESVLAALDAGAATPAAFEILHAQPRLPASARPWWPRLVDGMTRLSDPSTRWPQAIDELLKWLLPLVEERYDDAPARCDDLRVLAAIGREHADTERFLTEMTLDPPSATSARPDRADRDEDRLVLSTVHSAKGQQWRHVYVIAVSDGNFPNEYACADPKALDEERRLLYVALTRAERTLALVEPQRYYVPQQAALGARHVYGARSRFLDEAMLRTMEPWSPAPAPVAEAAEAAPAARADAARRDVAGASEAGAPRHPPPAGSMVAARVRARWDDP